MKTKCRADFEDRHDNPGRLSADKGISRVYATGTGKACTTKGTHRPTIGPAVSVWTRASRAAQCRILGSGGNRDRAIEMAIMALRMLTFLAILSALAGIADGQDRGLEPVAGLRAHLHIPCGPIPPGKPVWVTFSIENTTDEPITLMVPGAEPSIPSPEMGLPLSHVFSGTSVPPVVLETVGGSRWEAPLGYRKPEEAPILILAPHSSVGTRIDVREYYPALRGSGNFRFSWQPYGGQAAPASTSLRIDTLKQAVITLDEGRMTLRFFYDEAPLTVSNFIELAAERFYDGKSFHRVEPGYFLLGGCPRGDGTGIRQDGKRIPSEVSERPFNKGTVAMALLNDDPESASCQFFICNTRQKEWDGKYTAFGELVGDESFATLDRLMAAAVDDQGRPTRPIIIRSMRISEAPADAPAGPAP